jgi:hypothetical protein
MITRINEMIENYKDEIEFYNNPRNFLDGKSRFIVLLKDILSDLEELKKLAEGRDKKCEFIDSCKNYELKACSTCKMKYPECITNWYESKKLAEAGI